MAKLEFGHELIWPEIDIVKRLKETRTENINLVFIPVAYSPLAKAIKEVEPDYGGYGSLDIFEENTPISKDVAVDKTRVMDDCKFGPF